MKKYGVVFGLAFALGALSSLGIGRLQDRDTQANSPWKPSPEFSVEVVGTASTADHVMAIDCKEADVVDHSMVCQTAIEPVVDFASQASCAIQSPNCVGATAEMESAGFTINKPYGSETFVSAGNLVFGACLRTDGSVSFVPVIQSLPDYQPTLQGPYSDKATTIINPTDFRISIGAGFRTASLCCDEPISKIETPAVGKTTDVRFNQIAASAAEEIPRAAVLSGGEILARGETVVDEVAKRSKLREYLATLAKAKAELQDEVALMSDIMKAEVEIVNLRANRRIIDVEQSLQKIIDEFPNSPAALRAKAMLEMKPGAPCNLAPLPMY